MIGRKLLERQLQQVGVFGANEIISDHPDFDANYKVCKYYFLY
jgi:phosphatidylinositol 4-phosphatase